MKQLFDIEGMKCAACAARVEKAALGVPGVERVSVNVLKNTAGVTFSDQDGSAEFDLHLADAVCEAIEAAGFHATPRVTETPLAPTAAEPSGDAGHFGNAGSSYAPKQEERSGAGASSQTVAPSRVNLERNRPSAPAQRAAHAMLVRLVVSAVCALPLLYVAMGPMLGLPLPQMFQGACGHDAACPHAIPVGAAHCVC